MCDNLPDKIKDGTYVTNLDEYADISTHWIVLHLSDSTKTRFDSFSVEQIPHEIKNFIKESKITANIFRIQAYDSVIYGFLCWIF